VVLTSRNEELGKSAVVKIASPHNNVEYYPLDITDKSSITRFANYLSEKHKGLDILVNNAGMAFKGDAFDENVARVTLGTNYFGTLEVCQQLLPLVRDEGSVVNVSSRAGRFSSLSHPLKQQYFKSDLKVEELNGLMNKFISDVSKGIHKKEGWPQQAYGVSKMGVTTLSRILGQNEKRRVMITSCCPGWIATDMSGNSPSAKGIDEGADTPVWLALHPFDPKFQGKFFAERKEIDTNVL